MGVEAKKLSSKQLLQKLQNDYYADLMDAHNQGRKVAWASSIVPQEFLEVMDVAVAYPENHSAAIAAKGGAVPFLEHAEAMGYSNDICSYARINLAYADIMKSDIVNLPPPDFVVAMNNICNVLIKWYENLAKYWNVPFILLDTPFNTAETISDDHVAYVKAQFHLFIEKLEEICGKPFDYQKLDKVMEISNRNAEEWLRAMNYATLRPAPFDGFNMFNFMALMVCIRGKEETFHLYHTLAEEMETMAQKGESQFAGKQQYRLMWDGIACWPYLSHNYKTMFSNHCIITGSPYPTAWAMTYSDIDSMARVYASILNNVSMKSQVNSRVDIQRDCSVDGTIYHVNRSCKIMDFLQPEMRRNVYAINSIPYISFDGDQSDPKNYSKAQFETRIQALVENMEAVKQAKEAVQ